MRASPAISCRPCSTGRRQIASPLPGVLSPCGHSTTGKAYGEYQILHVNLAKRGYVVLTYDPVGQGERSQFWDADRGRSRFNLSCGEHAVLGNPLYLLGTNLARYRIWDGMRGLDYLTSRPEVDPSRIGCVGNSGGGTLTAYIAALDPRVTVAAIGCYITTLRRRMGNRIQEDPSADPEQDIFGFVGEGIDHAGLLALLAPRPTLLGTAKFDFFPLEGAKESFAEAKRLYEVAGVGDRIARAEAAERHGLTTPAPHRPSTNGSTAGWPDGRMRPGRRDRRHTSTRRRNCSSAPTARSTCRSDRVPCSRWSWEEFERKPKPARIPLRDLLGLDPDLGRPARSPRSTVRPGPGQTVVVLINGNESRGWAEETEFLEGVEGPRPCGRRRRSTRSGRDRAPSFSRSARNYADPLSGVEENIAYNAFLVGKSLVGMRVADVLKALERLAAKGKPRRVIVCGRRDAALVACLAAAVHPTIDRVACEEMLLSFRTLFAAEGFPINAASILPGLLQKYRRCRRNPRPDRATEGTHRIRRR